MALVCSPQHELASQQRVDLEVLRGRKMVCFESGLMIRREIDRALHVRNIEVEVAMEFDNIETIKQAIEIGAGISVLPAPTIRREVATNVLAAVPIADDQLERPIGIIHRQRKTLTPIIRKFIDVLEATHGDGVAPQNKGENQDGLAASSTRRQ